jgi:membrane fusion protein (multidrug efflux system)
MKSHGMGVALACLLALAGCGKKASAPGPPPPPVEVAPVVQKDVPIVREWIATLDGIVDAQIQPQVTGYLLRQDYGSGAFVKKGRLLFEIDPKPFQAALQQAEGQLAQAEAQAVKAQQDVDRDTPLAEAKAIAQGQLDGEVQALAAAQAVVKAQQAQLELARINLGYTEIRSPIDGVAGISPSDIGNLVGPTTILTTVSQVDPIEAGFYLGESEYLRSAKFISDIVTGRVPLAALQKPMELVLADGATYPWPGKFYSADRQLDPQTGTFHINAIFPNPGGLLRPGQFARIRVRAQTLKDALVVPQAAVSEVQETYHVAVLAAGNKAEIRAVKVGERVGSEWVITDGLRAGEQVIVQGTLKVRPGSPVQPMPYHPPAEKE